MALSPIMGLLLFVLILFTISWLFDFNEIVEWNRRRIPEFHALNLDTDLPFTHERFQMARFIAIVLWSAFGLALLMLYRHAPAILRWILDLGTVIYDEIRNSFMIIGGMPQWINWLTAAAFMLSTIARIMQYDFVLVHNDEIATYHYFVRYGWPLTMVYYPMPNNHVFFNLLFVGTSTFIDDYVLAGRIISLISYYLASFILYIGITRISGSNWSGVIVLFAILFLMPPSIYSVIGRGYMLTVLFGIIAWFALQKAMHSKRPVFLIVFTIASVLGCYTLPAFILVLFPMTLYLIWFAYKEKSFSKEVCFTLLLIVVGNLVFYLPVIIYNGAGALFANEDVTKNISSEFWRVYPIFLAELISYLFTVPTKGWLILLTTLLMLVFIYPRLHGVEKQFLIISAMISVAFFIFPLITGVAFPIRIITLMSFFWYGYIAIILGRILQMLSLKYSLGLLGMFIILIMYQGVCQHRNDQFTHILPDQSKRALHSQMDVCLQNGSKTYLDTSSEYVHMMINYKKRQGLQLTLNHKEARLMVIDTVRMPNYYRPDKFFLIDQAMVIVKEE
jgi:hypothetical protein